MSPQVLVKSGILVVSFLAISGSTYAGSTSATTKDKTTVTKEDNSAVNKEDQNTGGVTADQQGMSAADTEITRQIRADLMKEKNLSTYAHNVKIITTSGQVTLKGPVRTAQEAKELLRIAKTVAGVTSVYNEMSVVTN